MTTVGAQSSLAVKSTEKMVIPSQAARSSFFNSIRQLVILFSRPEERIKTGLLFLHSSEGDCVSRSVARISSVIDAASIVGDASLSAILRDAGRLAQAPNGSVGQAYAAFMSINHLSFDAYHDAVVEVARDVSSGRDEYWFRVREGHLHDLRHVVTGYGRDDLGEVCLLAYRWGQTGHKGMAMLTLLGLLKIFRPSRAGSVIAAVLEARRLGRVSGWLDAIHWESRLFEDLGALRRELRLSPLEHYPLKVWPIRSGAHACPA